MVSLVEADRPYRVHPHNLVGKEGVCKQGVCSVEISKPDMTYTFQNLGIQCVKKKEIAESLEMRKKIKVDPFKQGFDHAKSNPNAIDLNLVRLCFQVFLKQNRTLIPITPIVSDVVKDRKTYSDIQIVDESDNTSPVEGGKKILLFCEKVTKDDIEVHFTQYDKNGQEFVFKGEFTSVGVHKQVGISLKTPPYINKNISKPEKCSMFLYKPKSKEKSDAKEFWYLPNDINAIGIKMEALDMKPPLPANNMKRGRAQKVNPDDLSSGQIMVPTKAQLRGAGGGVTTVAAPPPTTTGGGTSTLHNLNQYLESSPNFGNQQPFQQMPGWCSYNYVTVLNIDNACCVFIFI